MPIAWAIVEQFTVQLGEARWHGRRRDVLMDEATIFSDLRGSTGEKHGYEDEQPAPEPSPMPEAQAASVEPTPESTPQPQEPTPEAPPATTPEPSMAGTKRQPSSFVQLATSTVRLRRTP